MEIKKQVQFQQEFFTPDLSFEGQELSSFFFIQNYKYISLSDFEVSKDFLTHILSYEKIISLCNYYLNVIENGNKTKFDSLKHSSGFNLTEIIDSLCEDLEKDTKLKNFLFDLQKKKIQQ